MAGIIFADIDKSLGHDPERRDGIHTIVHPEGDLAAVSQRTIDALAEMRGSHGFKVALITGRRRSGYERIGAVIPHDYGIIEHGSVILSDGNIDREWEGRMPVLADGEDGVLWTYAKQLEGEGYQIDGLNGGRTATFRVYLDKPDNLTEDEKLAIEERPHPPGITTTRNKQFVDVIPEGGGKGPAIVYLCGNLGINPSLAWRIGDDVNDISMLTGQERGVTLASAKPQVIDIVRAAGGYVSPHGYHEGTVDMLRHIRETSKD